MPSLPRPSLRAAVARFFCVLLVAVFATALVRAEPQTVPVYLFWQEGCPYCANAKSELEKMADGAGVIELRDVELGAGDDSDALFESVLAYFGYDRAAVPLVVIGDRSFLGFFSDGRSARLYREAVAACQSGVCPDIVAGLSDAARVPGSVAPPAAEPA